MSGSNVAHLKPVPLRPVIDVEAEEVKAPVDRDQAIDAYVDKLMRRSPALDRDTIRENVIKDLSVLATDGLNGSLYWTYKWTVKEGVYVIDWPDV